MPNNGQIYAYCQVLLTVRIWAAFGKLGMQGVASVLAERVRVYGKTVREETAEALAARVRRERDAEAFRRHFLTSRDGVIGAENEPRALLDGFQRLASAMDASPTLQDDSVMLYRDGYSVVVGWHAPYVKYAQRLHPLRCRVARPPRHGGHRFTGEKQELGSSHVRLGSALPERGRVARSIDGRLFSPKQLVDWAAKLLLARVRPASR